MWNGVILSLTLFRNTIFLAFASPLLQVIHISSMWLMSESSWNCTTICQTKSRLILNKPNNHNSFFYNNNNNNLFKYALDILFKNALQNSGFWTSRCMSDAVCAVVCVCVSFAWGGRMFCIALPTWAFSLYFLIRQDIPHTKHKATLTASLQKTVYVKVDRNTKIDTQRHNADKN